MAKINNDRMSYSKAGVDRDKEEDVISSILKIIKTTFKNGEIPEGHYAGSIPFGDFLISIATDGVGSKVILAQELEKYDTIGIDCVAMNVNDLIAIGSIPQAFVDYIAIREPDKFIINEIIKGIADGCILAKIPLVGGETAILPEIITPIKNNQGFDVAGTAIGIHHKDDTITGSKIRKGDVIIGIHSSGIHSNGLTLARKILENEEEKLELLKPTLIYTKAIQDLMESKLPVHGLAHITGGGITNLYRLGDFHFNLNSFPEEIPWVFNKIQSYGKIVTMEMYRTFNMGIGFIVIIDGNYQNEIYSLLSKHHEVSILGQVEPGKKITINKSLKL